MEPIIQDLRASMFYNFKCSLSDHQSVDWLTQDFQNNNPLLSTNCCWLREYKELRFSDDDAVGDL